ncbi:MAG: hypothetical protein KGH64_03455 [Candidatus Micrarchaeota archaeon]|nr:hypothetical protein [Candidatus Micrarchaeota archaeon]MDE1834368.1 hypothetical protein [Candidatus Micrarchaeota archaeon]
MLSKSLQLVRSEEDVIILRDIHLVTRDTEVKSAYERAFKELHLELGFLSSWYEPLFFRIPPDKRKRIDEKTATDHYPPDFVTKFFIDGKQVIIELHNGDSNYLERMGRFRKTFGSRFYYILVRSPASGGKNEAYIKRAAKKHVDECWTMPRVYYGRGRENPRRYKEWKGQMRTKLKELEARSDKIRDMHDWEYAAGLINVKRAS